MDDLSQKYFEKQIDFANAFQRYLQCKYYPCHSFHESQQYQNCLFCYCPIYPCENTHIGGKWINESTKPVWDCKECNFIHLDSTVKKILELFYSGRNTDEIKEALAKIMSYGIWYSK